MLLGATGTGKSATTAWLVERLQRPTLVIAPNKTLAAQLANEFRELLPHNAVEYFVSYYDYYQPEAYIPQTDTYIEKDSSINDEVERLRHSATNSLLTRRDVIVVASVSCIYGLGTPQEYVDRMVRLKVGEHDRARQAAAQARRRSSTPATTWRSPAAPSGCAATPSRSSRSYEELAVRIEMFGDEIERLIDAAPAHRRGRHRGQRALRLPGHPLRRRPRAHGAGRSPASRPSSSERLAELEQQGKLLEAQRLRMRTTYDLEMMRQVGICSGIENYSRHIDGRGAGHARRNTLLDYFPEDFLLVIDESHVTVPQIGGDVRGRHVPQAHPRRPRLPAAERDGQPAAALGGVRRADRPDRLPVGDPGPYELGRVQGDVVEQVIRPTGSGRPRGRRQADQGPDRRPRARDPRCAPSATSGCWSRR